MNNHNNSSFDSPILESLEELIEKESNDLDEYEESGYLEPEEEISELKFEE